MSSVSFDPVSGDSRVILGDAVLDYIHKTKPLTISSVPQRELENQGRVPEIFYQRFGRRTRLTSNRLEAVHVFPQIAVTLEDDLPWRMRGDTFTAPSLARNYFNLTSVQEISRDQDTDRSAILQNVRRSRRSQRWTSTAEVQTDSDFDEISHFSNLADTNA